MQHTRQPNLRLLLSRQSKKKGGGGGGGGAVKISSVKYNRVSFVVTMQQRIVLIFFQSDEIKITTDK